MAANKKTIDAVLDIAGIGPTEKRLTRAEKMDVSEFRQHQKERMQRIATKIADRLEAEAGELPVTSLAINLGILQDKIRDLDAGSVPVVTTQTNIQINGMDRNGIVALLSGKRVAKPVTQDATRQNLPSGESRSVLFAENETQSQNRQDRSPRKPVVMPVNA